MPLGERVLLALSHAPDALPAYETRPRWTVETALTLLDEAFPWVRGEVRGLRIMDMGCGAWYQLVALARLGAARVVGIEPNPRTRAAAHRLAVEHGVADRVAVRPAPATGDRAGYDIVVSQDSMEHFPRPLEVLEQMRAALAPGGRMLVVFGPPWLAPYGSHMRFFTFVPWVNLLFRERTVLAVRARYKQDGARRYEDVESGLNRMTVARFEALVAQAGLVVRRRRYRCLKGMDFLAHLPGARELLINQVQAELMAA